MFGLVWEACRAANQLWGWSCPSPGNTCLGSSPACRDRRSPNPDLPCSVEGSLSDALTMSPFTCMAHKHCHNPTSWAVAKASTNSGGTVRSQKLDLGATKNNNNNHADWKSGTAGMRSKRTDCSVVFFSKKDLTNPGVQSVTPTLASPPHCSLADVCGTPDWVRHALATSPGKGELERSRGQWCPRPPSEKRLLLRHPSGVLSGDLDHFWGHLTTGQTTRDIVQMLNVQSTPANLGFKCSAVMPDGPAAAFLRADQQIVRLKLCDVTRNGSSWRILQHAQRSLSSRCDHSCLQCLRKVLPFAQRSMSSDCCRLLLRLQSNFPPEDSTHEIVSPCQ